MYLRTFCILSCLWLPFTKGQGCPYSRTVVPGDPSRFIEMVHNVPVERHCAPSTEFDSFTCKCSVTSGLSWSAGLDFIGGLKETYPELAGMSLDALHNELSHITSTNIFPGNMQPPAFGSPNIGFDTKQGLPTNDALFLDRRGLNSNFLDLFQNIRPEDIPPDVISAIDRVLLLETNQFGANSFPAGNGNNFATNINNRNKDAELMAENILTHLLDPRPQNSVRNPKTFSTASNQMDVFRPNGAESLFLTASKPAPASKPKVNFQEINQLIESFQKLFPNTSPQPPINMHTPSPIIQKQSALDNFHSIADSILQSVPFPKKPRNQARQHHRNTPSSFSDGSHHARNHFQQSKTLVQTSRPQKPQSQQQIRKHQSSWSIPRQSTRRQNKKPARSKAVAIPSRKPPPIVTQPRTQRKPITRINVKTDTPQQTRQLQQNHRTFTQNSQQDKILTAGINQNTNTHPIKMASAQSVGLRNTNVITAKSDMKSKSRKQNRINQPQSDSQPTETTKIKNEQSGRRQIPSHWVYFGPVITSKDSALLRGKVVPESITFKQQKSKRKFDVSNKSPQKVLTSQQTVLMSPQKEVITSPQKVLTKVNKEIPQNESKQTQIQKTTRSNTTATATTRTPKNNTTIIQKKEEKSKAQEEVSATKLLKLIKKKLKQAKKTGNIPFSLLKMLLEKRQTLIRKLKEERKLKKLKDKQAKLQKIASEKITNVSVKSNNNEAKLQKIASVKNTNVSVISNINQGTLQETSTAAVPTTTNKTKDAKIIKTSTDHSPKKVITHRRTLIEKFKPENKHDVHKTEKNTDVTTTKQPIVKKSKISSKKISSQNTNTISSFSAGDPAVSLLELGSKSTKSKSRQSKKAEFRYDPFGAGAGLNTPELISLLSYKAALDSLQKRNIGSTLSKQSVVPELGIFSETTVPKLDLFPQINQRKFQDIQPKLTSPLLNQDLATITTFLKERKNQNRQHTVQPLESSMSKSLSTKSFFSHNSPVNKGVFAGAAEHSIFRSAMEQHAQITPQQNTRTLEHSFHRPIMGQHVQVPRKQNLRGPENSFHRSAMEQHGQMPTKQDMPAPEHNIQRSAIGQHFKILPKQSSQITSTANAKEILTNEFVTTSNSQNKGILQISSNLDAQKSAILEKLMQKLSALQAQVKNTDLTSTNRGGNGNSVGTPSSQGRSVNNQFFAKRNAPNFQQSSAKITNERLPKPYKQQSMLRTQHSSQPSAYSTMFKNVAAKEGASDAQEIMQDRITEMGVGARFAMGSPLGMNSEIHSQLRSTYFENHPMSFML